MTVVWQVLDVFFVAVGVRRCARWLWRRCPRHINIRLPRRRQIRLHGHWIDLPGDRSPAQTAIDSDALKARGVMPGYYVGINGALQRCPTCGYDPGKDQR